MKPHTINKKIHFIGGWYIDKNVCTNLIHRVEQLNNILFTLDSIIARYIDFKGDKDKFHKYLEKENADVKYREKNSGKSPEGNGKTKVRNIKSEK